MKNKIIDVIIALFFGIVLNYVEYSILKSDFLLKFIKENLVMLLIALLAINSTTLALIMTKIKELLDKTGKRDSFQKTKKEMLFSVKEHIALIIVVILLLMLNTSSLITSNVHATKVCNILLVSSLVYSLLMLYDVSKSAFIILDFDDK